METGREVAVRQLGEGLLRAHLRLRVGRQRLEGRVLGHVLVLGGAVHAAGRREHEALDARLFGRSGQRDRRVEVDLVRQLRVDVAERVVGERGQVDDRVVAAQVLGRHVAHVALERRNLGARREIAAAVEERVEPGDVVSRRGEERCGDGADVAVVAGDQDLHCRGLAATRACRCRRTRFRSPTPRTRPSSARPWMYTPGSSWSPRLAEDAHACGEAAPDQLRRRLLRLHVHSRHEPVREGDDVGARQLSAVEEAERDLAEHRQELREAVGRLPDGVRESEQHDVVRLEPVHAQRQGSCDRLRMPFDDHRAELRRPVRRRLASRAA